MIRRYAAALAGTVLFCSLAAPAARADVPAPAIDPQIAAAIATIDPARLRAYDERLVAFGTRSTFSEKATGGRGIFAARDWVAGQFRQIARASGGRMSVALDEYDQPADVRARTPRPVRISSVVATLRGDDPSRGVIVMSSHLDSRNSNNDDGEHDAPGADDNGSGVIAVLEVARVLATVPTHATILFATYDAEEQGLLGSGHHAKTLKDAHVDVEGDINNDIIGASVGDDGVKRASEVRLFSEALPPDASIHTTNIIGSENDSPSRDLARAVKPIVEAYEPGFTVNLIYRADRFLRGGDHESFNAQGFPGIRFVEPRETFAHQHQDVRVENGVQYGDLLRYVDFDYVAKVARANGAAIATLARAPHAPRDAKIETTQLTNASTLTWTASPGAVRYEILRRPTSAPTWTEISDAGTATRATLPFSKDDWIFGVRAVDGQGHASVAVYPTPQR